MPCLLLKLHLAASMLNLAVARYCVKLGDSVSVLYMLICITYASEHALYCTYSYYCKVVLIGRTDAMVLLLQNPFLM